MAPKGASPYFLNSERSSVDQEYEYYTIYERPLPRRESLEEIDGESDYSLPEVMSRTRLLYDEIQARRIEIVRSSFVDQEPLTLPNVYERSDNFLNSQQGVRKDRNVLGSAPVLLIQEGVNIRPKNLMSTIVNTTIQAKRMWLSRRRRRNTETEVMNQLQENRHRKTFITEGPREFDLARIAKVVKQQQRRESWPKKKEPLTHYFWSTQPSTIDACEFKFRKFAAACMKVVRWYRSVASQIQLQMKDYNKPERKRKRKIMVKSKGITRSGTKIQPEKESGPNCQSTPRFDATLYKREATRVGGLPDRVKEILKTEPHLRTDHQVMLVNEAIHNLKWFEDLLDANNPSFAKEIRMKLARCMYLESYEKGRLILKQGHRARAFYFIADGSVAVYKDETDAHGKPIIRLSQVLHQGNSFGEIALLKTQAREASVITLKYCELVRIERDDFLAIMAATKEKEWNERLQFMRKLNGFKSWTEKELETCNHGCRFEHYEDGTILIGNVMGSQDCVRYIYNGECLLVKEIFVKKSKIQKEYNTEHYDPNRFIPKSQFEVCRSDEVTRLVDNKGRRLTKVEIIARKLLTVCKLQRGDYFGTGEDLTRLYILAKGPVTVLRVPTMQSHWRQHKHELQYLAEAFDHSIPANEKLYTMFLEQKDWIRYRDILLQEIKERQKQEKSHKTFQFPAIIRDSN